MKVANSKLLVLKVGSALLVEADGTPRVEWLASLARDCQTLHAQGTQIIIVTSGAVALGRTTSALVLPSTLSLEQRQALAALGQVPLINTYHAAFAPIGLKVAQVLLTPDDTEERARHLNARRTLQTLLAMQVIPIINENDTVATAELRFGDNDRLAARVAQMIGADMLVLFSDIDGLYTSNPKQDATAKHLPVVDSLTSDILAMAGGSQSRVGTGGMVTKLAAAAIATSAGCAMIIADGRDLSPLHNLQQGAKHTLFTPSSTPLSSRKRWIAGMLNAAASVVINNGAEEALHGGKSLLPVGIVAVEGEFSRGDVVLVKNEQKQIVGRGMAAYNQADTAQIMGKHSRDVEAILGFAGREEFIHRDDFVLETRV
jgi:glutamate 5-kinase